MTTNSMLSVTAAQIAPAMVSAGSVKSQDGTHIGYRRIGRGPGLIVLHGMMSSGANHLELAEALSDAFTVFLPDRRGRGLSGPVGRYRGIRTEVEDLAALVQHTGAELVLGVSAAGIVTLHAAANIPSLKRIAVFEPPFVADPALTATALDRFDREIATGRTAAALVTAMRAAELGPGLFRALPRWLTERLTAAFMASQDGKPGPYVSMRALAPTLHYDFEIVLEAADRMDALQGIDCDVLLLGGDRSADYFKSALRMLESTLPNGRRIELPGTDHAATWDTDLGGKPAEVAPILRGFFSGEPQGR